jgi:hypothetical protein
MMRSALLAARRNLIRLETRQAQHDLSFPPFPAEAVIAKAIEVRDDFDRLELLKAWHYGDWQRVSLFMTDPVVSDPKCVGCEPAKYPDWSFL